MENNLENNSSYYIVEKILEKKIKKNGEILYKIKWEGYSVKNATWEPKNNLLSSIEDLIVEFEKENEEKIKIKEKKLKKLENCETFSHTTAESKKKRLKNLEKKEKKEKMAFEGIDKVNNSILEKKKEEILNLNRVKKFELDIVENILPVKKIEINEKYESEISELLESSEIITNLSKETKSQEKINDINENFCHTNKENINNSKFGHFKLEDVPKKIIHAKRNPINNKVYFLVEWEKRKFGFEPLCSYLRNSEIKKYNKNILVEFYEKQLNIE